MAKEQGEKCIFAYPDTHNQQFTEMLYRSDDASVLDGKASINLGSLYENAVASQLKVNRRLWHQPRHSVFKPPRDRSSNGIKHLLIYLTPFIASACNDAGELNFSGA